MLKAEETQSPDHVGTSASVCAEISTQAKPDKQRRGGGCVSHTCKRTSTPVPARQSNGRDPALLMEERICQRGRNGGFV